MVALLVKDIKEKDRLFNILEKTGYKWLEGQSVFGYFVEYFISGSFVLKAYENRTIRWELPIDMSSDLVKILQELSDLSNDALELLLRLN